VNINALRYLQLDGSVKEVGQRCIAVDEIPRGKLLAVYIGSIERNRPGVMDSLNHSLAQGKLVFDYDLFVDGTPREEDVRPGRLSCSIIAANQGIMQFVKSGNAEIPV
jgi:hypothetical protein